LQRQVVVTGIGVLSPLGDSPAALHRALCEGARGGTSHMAPIEGFAVEGLPMGRAVELRGFDPARYLGDGNFRPLDRTGLLAACAARLALDDAGWGGDAVAGGELALLVGTVFGSLRTIAEFDRRGLQAGPLYVKPFDFANSVINAAAGQTAIWHHLRGPNSTVSAGTASGVQAIALGADLVAEGRVEVALAGGAEELCWESFLAFSRAGMVANGDGTPRPFDAARGGFALGEGAAFLVLESAERARRRGARTYARLAGWGLGCDATHLTKPDAPGQARALRQALRLAGLQPRDVGYCNAHGTATRIGDVVERDALAEVWGGDLDRLRVSSTKALHGHLLGAAGALEAVATVLALHRRALPPNMHGAAPDPACALNLVAPGDTAAPELHAAISNSFAFGGTNSVLLFRRA